MPNDTIFSLIDRLASPASVDIRHQLDRAAGHALPVLLYGETGTGKDVWATYLHAQKGSGEFVNLHCADIPDTLLESQWFGFTKGAFTGAASDHPGSWLRAQGGVLYLNRIDLLKADMQAKLLRVIERKRFFPLGSTQEVSIDAHFIFSCADDIHHQVQTGQFRADLFYRISTFALRIPPLRERHEDISPLLQYFANQSSIPLSLSSRALTTLLHHSWPGNIRELENLVRRCAISDKQLDDSFIQDNLDTGGFMPHTQAQEPTLAQVEKQYIHYLLGRYKSKSQVARILGVTRKSLYNKIKRHGPD